MERLNKAVQPRRFNPDNHFSKPLSGASGVKPLASEHVIQTYIIPKFSKSQDVALTAGLTYGLAYTFELGFSLVSYFGKPA